MDSNPIDDDLLRELGLEPSDIAKASPQPVPKPQPPPATPAPQVPQVPKGPVPSAPVKKPIPPVQAQMPPRPAPQQPQPIPPQPKKDPQVDIKKMTDDLPIQVVAVLGKKSMSLKEVTAVVPGQVIELKKLPQDMIDLVANGKLVARGELVLVDGKVGIQIKQLVG